MTGDDIIKREVKTTAKLHKDLNPINVWAIAFGCIIGWGSFINPGKKFLPNSGVAGTTIAMVLGALVMIIIACSYAYMVPKYPKAGGEFTFAKTCFGKNMGFLCGWFLLAAYLANVPMNSTAIGLIVDGVDGTTDILKFGFHYSVAGFDVWLGEIILAMSILVLLGILNILGVKKASILQTGLAALLVVSVFVLFVSALTSDKVKFVNAFPIWGFDKAAASAAGAVTTEEINRFANQGSAIPGAILATFAIAPWAYVGFDTIPQAAEEFKFSYKKVMAIMVVAILFGGFVYISNNAIAATALANWPELAMADEWLVLVVAEELLGAAGKILVAAGVSCAVLSGITGFYMASSRLMYSMAREGFLPSVFGKLDEKHGTPRNAMIFCILVSLAGPVLGREALGWFVDMSAIGASIGYFFSSAATIVTVQRDKDGSSGLELFAALGVLFSIIFMVLQLIPVPGLSGVHFGKESYFMLFIWIAIGVYFFFKQRKFFTID